MSWPQAFGPLDKAKDALLGAGQLTLGAVGKEVAATVETTGWLTGQVAGGVVTGAVKTAETASWLTGQVAKGAVAAQQGAVQVLSRTPDALVSAGQLTLGAVGKGVATTVETTSWLTGQVTGGVATAAVKTAETTGWLLEQGVRSVLDAKDLAVQLLAHTLLDEIIHEKPCLIPVEPAQEGSEALVFISGFLSEDRRNPQERQGLWGSLRAAGWRGSLYYLWWDSSTLTSFALSLLKLGIGLFAHWEAHKIKAKVVGLEYAYPLLRELPERRITLMGFSLGARVAYYLLRALLNGSALFLEGRLKDVILLGGAVRRQADKRWGEHAAVLSGKLVNFYNGNDWVLSTLFRVPSLNRSPCGLKPILEVHPKIENFNLTPLINSPDHSCTSYLPHLGILQNKLGWPARRQIFGFSRPISRSFCYSRFRQ